jgi:YndJ-like protein
MQSGQLWLMIACLVHVPLALAAVLPRVMSEAEERRWAGLCRLWAGAAFFVFISFMFEPGRIAGLLVLPWIVFAFGVAFAGTLFTWRHRRKGPWHEVLLGVASLNFAGSAIWLAAHRAGYELFGFEEPWVTWTAAHFLVLGTSTLVIAAVIGRGLDVSRRHWLLAIMLVLAMPVTATGIQFQWALVERLGAWNTALATSWLAIEILSCRKIGVGWRRQALDLASLCLLSGVGLAVAFTLNMIFQWGAPSMDFMARWHAGLNTVGFGVISLLALATRPPDRANRPALE